MIIILLIGFLVLSLLINQYIGQKDILKMAVFSIVGYFMAFAVVVDLLMLSSAFSLLRATAITSSFMVCIYVVFRIKKGDVEKFQINCDKRNLLIVPALVVGLFLTINSFEFYGMGQDEGVYQTEAINFYYGRNEWSHPIEEVDKITDSDYKQVVTEYLWGWLGFDSFYDMDELFTPGFTYDENYSLNGMWHGIPSFPAMLGVSAKVFGIKHMMLINCIFYLCLIAIAGMILNMLEVDRVLSVLLTMLISVSPVLVWVAKSALTEPFFACIIGLFTYLIINQDRRKKYLSIIPIIALMFFHISAYVLVPLFLLVYWYLYVETKDKMYIRLAYAIPVIYFVSCIVAYALNPVYAWKNITTRVEMFGIPAIAVVVIACVVAEILTLIISKVRVNASPIALKWIFAIVCVLSGAYWIQYIIRNNLHYDSIKMLTMASYTVLTGFWLIPLIIVYMLIRRYNCSQTVAVIGIEFLYLVFAYSLLYKEIWYYYYYARYLAPYLIGIYAMYGAFSVDFLAKAKNKKIAKLVLCGVVIFGICGLSHYTVVLTRNTDDSRLLWDATTNILDAAEAISNDDEDASVGIVSDSIGIFMYYPIRAVLDECYISNGDYSVDKIIEQGIVPDVVVTTDNLSNMYDYRLVLEQYSLTEEDDLTHPSYLFGLPKDISFVNEYTIRVYQRK